MPQRVLLQPRSVPAWIRHGILAGVAVCGFATTASAQAVSFGIWFAGLSYSFES